MKESSDESLWLIVAILVAVAICLFILTKTADAETYELRFQNPGTVVAYEQIETPWGTYPTDCAPGATCSVTIETDWGRYPGVQLTALAGGLESAPSNALDMALISSEHKCHLDDACRADFDSSRSVTIADFARFLAQLGAAW